MVFFSLHARILRSSRPEVFCKKVFFEISQNSQENTCARVSLLRPATSLKKRLRHRCFPVNVVKFLRTPFHIQRFWWLHLNFYRDLIFTLDSPKLCFSHLSSNISFLYHLKTSENQRFSDVFKGCRNGILW